jgi:CheY-like chemotaxis protein
MSTILLADDSLTIQKVVELTFGETEHDVIAVPDGAELLRRLPEVRPDLVICDVIMPGMEGYEVCQQIKSDPTSLHIPVILLTGTFEPFDRDRALAAGCSEIITKPFEARKLVETVERLLSTGAEGEPVDDRIEPGAVTPPPPIEPEPAAEEFGTHLAEPEMEEALEYTSSGFADMQDTADAADSWSSEPPEDGLEFDIGDDTANRMQTAEADDEPFPEPPPLSPEEVAEFSSPDTQDAPFTDDDRLHEPSEDPSPFTDDVPPAVAETDAWHQAAAVDDHGSAGDPFEAMPLEPLEPSGSEFEAHEDDAPTAIEPTEAFAPEPEPATDAWDVTSDDDTGDRGPDTSPMEADPVPSHDEAETAHSAVAPVSSPDLPGPAPAVPAGGGLSDEDVERIARRVAEIAAERIEQIAWEVIPDMAEIVVRERVRELEAEVEGATRDPVQ